jgi:predicted AlkP superfamily phosphohydrolase/phosphomutase
MSKRPETQRDGVTRRSFLASAAAGVVLAGCGGLGSEAGGGAADAPKAKPTPKGRVVILGFDGVEPSILQTMMDRGEAPNYAKLAQAGTFKRLGSTTPPQSPTAWTSFSTCKNPGGHNIFDFIRRDPAGPFPKVGTGEMNAPTFSPDGSVKAPPSAISFRKGMPFWMAADGQGLKCKVFNVPFAFPADPLQHGLHFCGLGAPDLRGTTSTSFILSDTFTPTEMDASLSGGKRLSLAIDGSGATKVAVPGPRHSSYKPGDPKMYTTADLALQFDRAGHRGSAECDGAKVDFEVAKWSEWISLPFKMTDKFTAWGIVRFYPLEIGEHVRLYMTCVQFHPEHPYVPITQPAGYSKEIKDRYGLFKTIGWDFDTYALRQDRLTEDGFLDDVRGHMAWRSRMALDEMDRGDFDLLIAADMATDRVGHMFWRFRDPQHPMYDPALAEKYAPALEESYRLSDKMVGEVMAKLGPNDLLMVLSDHGFESWRRGFDVNAWLEKNKYLAVKEPGAGYLLGVDWAKTKAYSVGLSSLYLNVSGRERFGSVGPTQTDSLIAELKDKLMTVKDDKTGAKVFSNIYTRHDYHGEAMAESPDIVFGYGQYYQSSKGVALGYVGTELFEDNLDKWSGDHASSDRERLPGIFFCNRKVEATDPNIMDLGVMALAYLGVDVPADYEGRDLLG